MYHLKSVLRTGSELLIPSRRLCNFQGNCQKLVRFCSSMPTDYEIKLKPQFSQEESEKVLDVLNTSSVEELKRYKIPQNRIKNIRSWRNKKGTFQSLSDILEVEGLSVKILEKLCQTIISSSNDLPEKLKNEIVKVNRKQFLSPPIDSGDLDGLCKIVALHIGPSGISWVRLSKDNHLDHWSFYDFRTLPSKVLPADTFQLAVGVLNKLPPGDIYILEGSASTNGNLQTGKSVVLSTQQLELTSMLIALINTSTRHNPSFRSLEEGKNCICNKIYFLKSRLPARLFGTLVGQEKVSAVRTITELLTGSENVTSQPYSSVTFEENLKSSFLSHSAVNKELLGQPLMLAITFMDVCVKKNQAALKAISFKGK